MTKELNFWLISDILQRYQISKEFYVPLLSSVTTTMIYLVNIYFPNTHGRRIVSTEHFCETFHCFSQVISVHNLSLGHLSLDKPTESILDHCCYCIQKDNNLVKTHLIIKVVHCGISSLKVKDIFSHFYLGRFKVTIHSLPILK
jgi:hypothetical protein